MRTYELFEAWKPKFTKQTIFDYIPWQDADAKDLYPGYTKGGDPYPNASEYHFDTKEKAENYARRLIDMLDSLPDPIPIFRAVKAKSTEDVDVENPGESWSFERISAVTFGSHNDSNFLMTAKINKKDVDWNGTVRAYALFSGELTPESENEIVVGDPNNLIDMKVEPIKWKKKYGLKMESVFEAKSVGTLYHFTNVSKLIKILSSNIFKYSSTHEQISFTRNKDFAWQSDIFNERACVRIDVDGGKISENYKITPYQYDFTGFTGFNKGRGEDQYEEVIRRDIHDAKKYIKSVVIYRDRAFKIAPENWDFLESFFKNVRSGFETHKYKEVNMENLLEILRTLGLKEEQIFVTDSKTNKTVHSQG